MKPRVFHGANAVVEACIYYGLIDRIQAHLIEEEGFVAGRYLDVYQIETEGVGLTGEFKGKNFFTEVYPLFFQRAKRLVTNFDEHPEDVQKAIVSAVYRGDMGPKTARLLSQKKYHEAAEEYLNHKEYQKLLKINPKHGVVQRMHRNSQAFRKAGGSINDVLL